MFLCPSSSLCKYAHNHMYARAAHRAVTAHVCHGTCTSFAKSCVAAGHQREALYGCCQTNFRAPWLRRCVICRWCDRRCGQAARSGWRLQRILVFVQAVIVWTALQWLGVRFDGVTDNTQELKPAVRVYVDLYSAFLRKAPQMRSEMDHTVLPANYIMPAFTPQPRNITALWLVLILPSHGG